jgi:hypothetical protein
MIPLKKPAAYEHKDRFQPAKPECFTTDCSMDYLRVRVRMTWLEKDCGLKRIRDRLRAGQKQG